MKTKYKFLAILPLVIVILDQLTKLLIVMNVDFGSRHPVIEGFFDIVYFRNEGAAFGIFSGLPDSIRQPFFYLVAFGAVIMLGFLYRTLKDDERLMPIAFSLVYGGIIGNISDRIFRGSVVDFLSFHVGSKVIDWEFLGYRINFQLEWPAFNIADSAITVAMVLLIYGSFFCCKKNNP